MEGSGCSTRSSTPIISPSSASGEMTDAEYQALLEAHVRKPADFLKAPLQLPTRLVLQSITQTS